MENQCVVEGCERNAFSVGLCVKHYHQNRRKGGQFGSSRDHDPFCKVEGCGRHYKALGYCQRHYLNYRRCGNPLGTTRRNERGAHTRHPLYHTWANMRRRCEDPHEYSYKNYGGRGITVCERWKDFWNFADDMGQKPSRLHSIDRIDVNGNYESGNCRWATIKEQSENKRNTRLRDADRELITKLVKQGWTRTLISERHGLDLKAVQNFAKGITYQPDANDYDAVPAPVADEAELKFKPVTASICEVDGCDRIVQTEGLCRFHWRRKHESKTLAQVVDKFATRQCKGCGCDLPDHARPDLLFCTLTCKMKFYRREGCYAPDKLLESRGKCTVEGCEKPQHGKQVCRAHYMKKWHADKAAAKPG